MSKYNLTELLGMIAINADDEGMVSIPAGVIYDTINELMIRDRMQERIDELEKARAGSLDGRDDLGMEQTATAVKHGIIARKEMREAKE